MSVVHPYKRTYSACCVWAARTVTCVTRRHTGWKNWWSDEGQRRKVIIMYKTAGYMYVTCYLFYVVTCSVSIFYNISVVNSLAVTFGFMWKQLCTELGETYVVINHKGIRPNGIAFAYINKLCHCYAESVILFYYCIWLKISFLLHFFPWE